MPSPNFACASAFAAALTLPAVALAGDPDRCTARLPVAAALAAPSPSLAAPPAASILGPTAAAHTLERARGGTAVANTTTVGGTVSANSASHVLTGANIIQSGSFADMSGMPIVIQNSGANVLIQNATVINLQLK